MNIKSKLKLYKELFQYFVKKDHKAVALLTYFQKMAVRGGTFWGFFMFMMTINVSVAYTVPQPEIVALSLTYVVAHLTFLPIGILYGIIRELYFDYESTRP